VTSRAPNPAPVHCMEGRARPRAPRIPNPAVARPRGARVARGPPPRLPPHATGGGHTRPARLLGASPPRPPPHPPGRSVATHASGLRRCRRQPEQNAILFGRLLPNRRPTDAILLRTCSVLGREPRDFREDRAARAIENGIGLVD